MITSRTLCPVLALATAVCTMAAPARADDSVTQDAPALEKRATPSRRGALLERARSQIARVYDDLEQNQPQQALLRIDELGPLLPDGERLVLKGRALLQLGNARQARKHLIEAVQNRPQYGEYHYWLGMAYQAGSAHSLAIESFRQANLKGLESAELHVAWAQSLAATEDVLRGIRRERFEPEEAEGFQPGTILRDGMLVDCVYPDDHEWVMAPRASALFHAEKATQVDPEHGPAWLMAGQVWARAGFHAVAVERFQSAAALVGGDDVARCHHLWAESLYAMGDFEKFVEHAKQSVRASAREPALCLAEAYDRAAKGHAMLGRSVESINCLKFACELKPTVQRHLQLADALMQSARHDEATVKLKAALKLEPTRKEKRLIRSRLLQTMRLSHAG